MSVKDLSSICSPSHFVAESIFFLFKIGESLLEPSIRLYIYQSVCSIEFRNDTSCFNLRHYPDREDTVQRLSANYLMCYKLILNLPVVFIGLFCGAWSDRIGRKMPVLLSSFGTIIGTLFYMLSMVTDRDGATALLPLVFVGAAVRGAFGKSAVMTMALHSYVSDISSEETRTRRLGKLLSMNYFGYFVGSLMAGAILEVSGFEVVFCIVVIVNCFCVIIAILFMHDSYHPVKSESTLALSSSSSAAAAAADADEDGVKREGHEEVKKTGRMPFKWKHLKESIDVLTRSRPHRLEIILLFCVIFIQQICKSGEVDITLLFTEKSPLHWRRSLYGYLLATDYACLGIASAIILPCLIRFLHLRDMTLVTVGVLFKVVRLVMLAFSSYTWIVFLSVVVGCPSALIISCAKSIISKLVEEDELGKTFSLLSCGETLSNFLGSIIFTSVYSATVSVFPGLMFILDASVFFLLFLALLLLATCDSRFTTQYKDYLFKEISETVIYGATTESSMPSILETTPQIRAASNGSAAAAATVEEKDETLFDLMLQPAQVIRKRRSKSEEEEETKQDDQYQRLISTSSQSGFIELNNSK